MIEATLPLSPDLWATVPAPDPVPLLEQLATRRLSACRNAHGANDWKKLRTTTRLWGETCLASWTQRSMLPGSPNTSLRSCGGSENGFSKLSQCVGRITFG